MPFMMSSAPSLLALHNFSNTSILSRDCVMERELLGQLDSGHVSCFALKEAGRVRCSSLTTVPLRIER